MDGLAAVAYERIETLIIFESVEPGSLLSEKRLMELTGLGRTPVREAIQTLARHRMVHIYPSRGILIPPIAAEDQFRLLEVRRPLEATAVQLASARHTTAQRDEMHTLLDRLAEPTESLRDYADLVGETHHLVTSAADNGYLADAIAPLQSLSRRFWHHHVRDEHRETEIGTQYLTRILEGVLSHDAAEAVAATLALNDYLIAFTHATLAPSGSPPDTSTASVAIASTLDPGTSPDRA